MSTEQEETVKVEVEETSQVLVGDLLREQREKRGMTQQEVADRLCLKLSMVKSIDQNNLEFDQVATFTRGYLRSYAKVVGLDEKVLLAALDGAGEAQHVPQEMQSFSRKTRRDRHDRRIMKISWLIFAIIFGISAIWWYQNQQDTLEESSLQDANEPVAGVVQPLLLDQDEATENAAVEIDPASEQLPTTAVLDDAEPVTEQAEAVTIELAEPVVEEPAPVAVASAPETEVAGAEPSLAMSFDADCWVQVKDASGNTLVTGVKKAGQSLNVKGQTPYSIVLGAPEGVKMTFASEPVDLSGYTSGKVARFTLP